MGSDFYAASPMVFLVGFTRRLARADAMTSLAVSRSGRASTKRSPYALSYLLPLIDGTKYPVLVALSTAMAVLEKGRCADSLFSSVMSLVFTCGVDRYLAR